MVRQASWRELYTRKAGVAMERGKVDLRMSLVKRTKCSGIGNSLNRVRQRADKICLLLVS